MNKSTKTKSAPTIAGALSIIAMGLTLAGCGTGGSTNAGSPAGTGGSEDTSCSVEGEPFSTDDAEDSVEYSELESALGPVPEPEEGTEIGSIMKFLGNQYWVALSEGQSAAAEQYGIPIHVQAAATEADQVGQLNAAETMLQNDYTMLVSPQTDTNLCPAFEKAEKAGLLVVNVNDAVLPGAKQWVGPNQIQNGISAAEFVLESAGEGAQVAVIEGQAGVYAAKQRTEGFTATAEEGGLEVVASVPADWDIAKARDAATTIISQYPDLQAIYANNDGMALGVAEAVNSAGKKGEIMVIGTDGVEAAYDAIRAGDLTATVDSYPFLTGQVSVNVALRLLGGQDVPRAVYTPQALITSENVDDAPPTLD